MKVKPTPEIKRADTALFAMPALTEMDWLVTENHASVGGK
jgi:hypothetical protein